MTRIRKSAIDYSPDRTMQNRMTLLTIMFMMLLMPSRLYSADVSSISITMMEINKSVYMTRNYNEALNLCKEAIKLDNIRKYDFDRITGLVNLIENYSDCDQEPLSIYFEAEQIPKMWRGGKGHTKENWIRQGNLYRRLLTNYPNCNIAGFVQYLLAEHYKRQIGMRLAYLENEVARQKSIEAYNAVTEQYPLSVFPTCGYPMYNELGLPLAPLSQINIAWLYSSIYHVKSEIEKAIEAYHLVIENYPDSEDEDGLKLALSAYISVLEIYCGDEVDNEYRNILKAREVCEILLEEYPNQRYEIEGWYFGEIHPEALIKLASLETDSSIAINLYKRIILDYPESITGKSGSGAVGLYLHESLGEMIELINNPALAIKECEDLLTRQLDRNTCGHILFRIAQVYEKDLSQYEIALAKYQEISDKYHDIPIGGEGYSLGDLAKEGINRIQERG